MLKNVLILLLIATLVYVFRDNQKKVEEILAADAQIEELQREVGLLRERMGPTAANIPRAGNSSETPPSAQAPSVTIQNILCRICNGSGKIEKKTLSGSTHSTPCRACGGRGNKDLQIPTGASLCTTCGGIGHVVNSQAMSGLGRCTQCRGLGYTR